MQYFFFSTKVPHSVTFSSSIVDVIVLRWFFFSSGLFIFTLKFFFLTTPTFIFGYLLVYFLFWSFLVYKDLTATFLQQVRGDWLLFCFMLGAFVVYVFSLITNLISYLLLLETLAILYYFFFLNYNTALSTNLVQYKHLLLLYIVVSFFTTILFAAAIILFTLWYGTISFLELSFLNSDYLLPYAVLTISLLWKFGAPGFHFFKLELYQYLSGHVLVLFSLFSLLLNVFLWLFIVYFLYSGIYPIGVILVYFLIISLVILLSFSLSYTTISQFIAYSTLSTVMLVLVSTLYN